MFPPQPTVLAGDFVVLEPLQISHTSGLFEVLNSDVSIWDLRPIYPPKSFQEMEELIKKDLEIQKNGSSLAFTQVERKSGEIVGSTSFMKIDVSNSTLEIGKTWITKHWQRTGINTEAKFLLLRHAFEILKVSRVQLRTDLRNLQSQAAIERLGAIREGVFRKDLLIREGYFRDTVMYSILSDEWHSIRERLTTLMQKKFAQR